MKQAVVLIHGIGEQKPMGTLRRFVAAVLPEAKPGRAQYWSKPDRMSELFELRRLQSPGRTGAHFFEYYWAYNIEGTKVQHLFEWIFDLVRRRSRDVPTSAKTLWMLSQGLLLVLLATALFGGLAKIGGLFASQSKFGIIWLSVMAILFLSQYVLLRYLGDAARYLSPQPSNIALRQKIRSEGVRLLKELHERGEYDRIIVVGHSLGSVIGYDIITKLWQEYHATLSNITLQNATLLDRLSNGKRPQPVLRDELWRIGSQLHSNSDSGLVAEYRNVQLRAWCEQRDMGCPWRITDFITLGSPLAHGMLLLARNQDDFARRKTQRELPLCPPVAEEKGYAYVGPVHELATRKFSPLVLHHAAPFAVTRWTNLFFPAHGGLFGDIVGGPLREVFGPGILDVPVMIGRGWLSRTPLSHTRYWPNSERVSSQTGSTSPAPAARTGGTRIAVEALRDALALADVRRFD